MKTGSKTKILGSYTWVFTVFRGRLQVDLTYLNLSFQSKHLELVAISRKRRLLRATCSSRSEAPRGL